MTENRTRTRTVAWAALPALALSLTGCQMETPFAAEPQDRSVAALEELRALPSLEDTKRALWDAVNQISTEASRIVPGAKWKDLNGGESDRCQVPYDQTGGKRHYFPNRVAANVEVSEDQWARVEAAAKRAAAGIGATARQAMADAPGDHDVFFSGPAGLSINVGYQGNIAISGYTGCRLPTVAK